MSSERVRSDIFIGRETQLQELQQYLALDSKVNIVSIHTNGGGGIGKTQLLLKMRAYCAPVPDRIICSNDLIDFYQVENHTESGVMQSICENLDSTQFPKFEEFAKILRKSRDTDNSEEILPKLEEVFVTEYDEFISKVARAGKKIVLLFDTYEVIQGSEIIKDGQKRKETTAFSRWLETTLFPNLSKNTLVIVSGRYPLNEIDQQSLRLRLKEMTLPHFEYPETIEFWKECFKVESNVELVKIMKLNSEDSLQDLHTLAGGRPILLALLVDWINYERNQLSSKDLLQEIQDETQHIADAQERQQAKTRVFERV